MKRVVIHHNGADGKCSAAIAGRFQAHDGLEVVYVPVNYTDPVPWREVEALSVLDEIWIVDFSFSEEDMFRLSQIVGESNFYWFDHHETRQEMFDKFQRFNGLRVIGTAACMLVWMFCAPKCPEDNDALGIPFPVRYIADRDVWRFRFGDATRNFYESYLQEDNTAPGSGLWDWYFTLLDEDQIQNYVEAGERLRGARRKQLKAMAIRQGYPVFLDKVPMHLKVLKMNYPGSGDMGEVVQQELGYDICWCWTEKQVDVVGMVRENHLYSASYDVGAVAKANGGGGHKGAAGFIEQL